jgi:hypothetical protein
MSTKRIIKNVLSEAKKKKEKKEDYHKKLQKLDRDILLDYITSGGDPDDKFAEFLLKANNILVFPETIGFFRELLRLNENLDANKPEDIIIPKIKKYNVYYKVEVKEWKEEYWKVPVMAYSEDEINERLGDDIEFWNGDNYDYHVSDSETLDVDVTDIVEE